MKARIPATGTAVACFLIMLTGLPGTAVPTTSSADGTMQVIVAPTTTATPGPAPAPEPPAPNFGWQ